MLLWLIDWCISGCFILDVGFSLIYVLFVTFINLRCCGLVVCLFSNNYLINKQQLMILPMFVFLTFHNVQLLLPLCYFTE